MKMDMRKYAGENYLKPDDVRAGPRRLKIVRIRLGTFDRPEVIFNDESILSLNVTNTKTLTRAYGPHSETWPGREIELRLGKAPYQGTLMDSVLVTPVSPPIGAAELQAAQDRASAENQAEMNDDIPF
jgi:hypothetical protein